MSHVFRKKWGQNFLIDNNLSKKIVNLLNIKDDDLILEIGPGKGSLTKYIVEKTNNLHLVEIDPLLSKELETNQQYKDIKEISNTDILDYDLSTFNKYKVIGNIPYNISTPIIFKFLNNIRWSSMILMIQKEVAERIVAKPNSKAYGRLSVMCQALSDINIEFNISKNVFIPKPKVNSSVVRFTPNDIIITDINRFSSIVKHSFSQRRKKIKNNLTNIIPLENYKEYANKRAQELTVDDFIKISSK